MDGRNVCEDEYKTYRISPSVYYSIEVGEMVTLNCKIGSIPFQPDMNKLLPMFAEAVIVE